MSSLYRRLVLFHAHSYDLSEWGFSDGKVVICPICGQPYTFDAILSQLTVGHIWPKSLREENKNLFQHMVLLCNYCNSTAGSRGDAQIQLVLKNEKAEKAGEIFGERKVAMYLPDKEAPIRLNANVVRKSGGRGTISFAANRNNPAEVVAFKELAKTKQKFNMQVLPNHLINPKIAKAGLITSAYLYAFYTFGYRYVVSDLVNPTRQYIGIPSPSRIWFFQIL